MISAASSPPEKPSNDKPPAKRGRSEAAGTIMHIQGATLEVLDEAIITVHSKDKHGKPMTYGYTACSVREISRE